MIVAGSKIRYVGDKVTAWQGAEGHVVALEPWMAEYVERPGNYVPVEFTNFDRGNVRFFPETDLQVILSAGIDTNGDATGPEPFGDEPQDVFELEGDGEASLEDYPEIPEDGGITWPTEEEKLAADAQRFTYGGVA